MNKFIADEIYCYIIRDFHTGDPLTVTKIMLRIQFKL